MAIAAIGEGTGKVCTRFIFFLEFNVSKGPLLPSIFISLWQFCLKEMRRNWEVEWKEKTRTEPTRTDTDEFCVLSGRMFSFIRSC